MDRESIAIIGIGCRFPGAKNPEAFWQLLHNGVDAITEVSSSRWNLETFHDRDTASPDKMNIRWGGFLEEVDLFDPQFFGITSREAVSMDPQQRLLLEVAWEALEDSGQIPERLAGKPIGVFIGVSSYDYYEMIMGNPKNFDAYAATGNTNCIAANRISYIFGFTGPSIAIDTACSSSLVAVHLACQSLWSGECSLALVGGVHVMLSPRVTVGFAKGGFLAPDGRCKTFDAGANGYVRSEGAGMMVLKPLSQALAQGDRIYAVIKGSAVNQNGRGNGLTAPNPQAQSAVLRSAYQLSGVSPGQIQYIEAHSVGTSLGDPIEIKALGKVLAQDRPPGNYCAVGSVKTNIGHLEAAAGIAGLIKVALSLKHRQIPPNLHFQQPNPYIPFDKLPLRVQQTLEPWPQGNDLAIAGVSSFGFGGTNAHVVLAEAPSAIQNSKFKIQKDDVIERQLQLLTLSAKSENALRELAQRYQEFLINQPEEALKNICFTANTGRTHFDYRLAVLAESTVQLQKELSAFTASEETTTVVSGQVKSKKRPLVAFLFTGQGSQYTGMGRQLYETAPIFRQTLDRCDEILRSYLGKSLLTVLYPEAGETSLLDQTAYTQPALFAIEYALSQLWKSWGVVPTAVMGHSLGEYVAATVAGVLSLEDGLKLVAQRSRLMQSLPPEGEMAVVFAASETIRAITEINNEKISIAAINTPENTVISGELQAVLSICTALEAQGIKTKKLQVSHAFHSPLMEPMLAEFHQIAASITYAAPQIDLISNLTAEGLTKKDITPEYWVRHLRECVRFADSLKTLQADGYEIFVEIGPKPILLGMGRNCLPEGVGVMLPSLRQGQDDWKLLLQSLGKLYTCGVSVDWSGFDRGYGRELISLPTYPFERQRYWIETSEQRYQQAESLSPENSHSPITNLLEAGNIEQLAKLVLSSGNFSSEQIKLLPELLSVLVKEHKQHHVPDFIQNLCSFVSPRNTVELQLVQIWSKILKVDNVGVKDNFFDLGGNSLLAPYLMAQIKQQFGKDISLATLFQNPTIEELATMVQKDADASGWSPLVAIQPTGSNPPLFCLPGAGGFPFYLYNLARCLGLDQPFYTFQAHGRDRELAAISQVEDIAAQYLEAMQVVQPQGPYFLAGHSFGGKVVYEMAQQLLSQGQVVALVAILDTTAPITQPKQEEWDDVKHMIEIAKLLKVAFTKDLDMDADPLLSLAPEDQLKYVLEYLKMVDILPPDADTTYLKKLLQAFKADFNAHAEYVPQEVNPIAITLFRASESVPEEPAALQSELLEDLAWGWSAFSSEPVDVQFVPGTHVTMMTQPHVQILAERLKACIEQAQAFI